MKHPDQDVFKKNEKQMQRYTTKRDPFLYTLV